MFIIQLRVFIIGLRPVYYLPCIAGLKQLRWVTKIFGDPRIMGSGSTKIPHNYSSSSAYYADVKSMATLCEASWGPAGQME